MTVTDSPRRQTALRFSLRTMLVVMMLAAAYLAGWVSHREWNRRNVDEAVMNAVERVGGPVDVEIPAPDVMVLRGQKDEVERMQESISDIEAAARK